MIKLVDQLGRELVLDKPAEKIISLVPSQTELLYTLGLEEEVIGITKFCVHPDEWFRSKERVGGTKTLDLEKINRLQSDLIIGNKEENSQSDIEQLPTDAAVYMSDIYTFEDAIEMMHAIGQLTAKEEEAKDLITNILSDIEAFPLLEGTVLYFMWNEPYMVAGRNTFIGHVLERLGLTNSYHDEDGRYKEIDLEEIVQINPDFIFLSSEPYPFKDEHLKFLRTETKAKVMLVDGEIFSWYGSRMLKMKDYFKQLFATSL